MDIEGYKIQRKIGEGAMASVYLAVQESLGRKVALKVLAPALACRSGFTDRFLNEARIVARLNHSRIVSVYDLGVSHPNYYMAMEFLLGGTLHRKIKQGITIFQAVQYIRQLGRALDYAHHQGVIHRDIKAQNIIFRNSHVPVLTDFGIARLMDGDLHLTIPGRTMGSPLYMSPEQISGRRIDARSDLYSVGILFYEMLTNQLPYQANHIMAVALMHKTAPIPTLPDKLSMFQPLLDKLLAKDPDHRYASAQELIDALERIASENHFPVLDIHEGPDLSGQPVRKPDGGKRHCIHGRDNPADDATQPAIEPLSGSSGAGSRDSLMGDEFRASDQPGRQMDTHLPGPQKGRTRWKKALVAVGAMLTVAGGCFFYYSFSRSTRALSKPPALIHRDASEQVGLHTGRKKNEDKKQVLPDPFRNHLALQPGEPGNDHHAVAHEVADLLARAEKQLAGYRLSTPAGDNCYETYQQIKSLDPSNPAAASLLMKIGGAYHNLARSSQAQGRFQQGLMYVDKGLSLLPEDEALLALRVVLKAGLAMQTLKSAQQARRQVRQIDQQNRIQAVEQTAMEKNQQMEKEFEVQDTEDVEQASQVNETAGVESKEESKAEIEIKNPEKTTKDDDWRNRLFGTF